MTRHLADACALVGFYLGRPDFPPGLRALIEDEAGAVLVAATTVWEIAIKVAKGGLPDIRDCATRRWRRCSGRRASGRSR